MVDAYRIAQRSKKQSSSSMEERVRDATEHFRERRKSLAELREHLEQAYDESDPVVEAYLDMVLLILDFLGAKFHESYLQLTGYNIATDEAVSSSPLLAAMAFTRAKRKDPNRIKDEWTRAAVGATRAYAETAGVAADVRRAMQDVSSRGEDASLWAGIEAWLCCLESFMDMDIQIVAEGRERYSGHLEETTIGLAGLAITNTSLRANKDLRRTLSETYEESHLDALYREMPSAIFEALRSDPQTGTVDVGRARNRATKIIRAMAPRKKWEVFGLDEDIIDAVEDKSAASSPADIVEAREEAGALLDRAGLSSRERQVWLLVQDDYLGREIADMLGIAQGTVRVIAARAKKKIKAAKNPGYDM